MADVTIDRTRLRRDGYCRAGALAPSWPEDGPDRPVRDVLAAPGWMRDLARSEELRSIASRALDADARPVRANLFVKSAASNWSVAWHQDRVVSVRERREVQGFGGWSVKVGQPHANAPAEVLRRMVAVRLHLDPCRTDSGALEVAPGTHADVLSQGEIAERVGRTVLLEAVRGEVLVLRPLLLHRSGRSTGAGARRVLHVEFAAEPLPAPLTWLHATDLNDSVVA